MNIAKLIAKFLKSGLKSLSVEEKTLLQDNSSLMSPAQKSKFEEEVAKEETTSEEEVKEEEETKETKEEEAIDEKALTDMISKSVQSQLEKSYDNLSTEIVNKFLAGVKGNRAKAIDTGVKVNAKANNETRDFMKALVGHNTAKLNEMSKATTYNQDGDDAKGGYLIPEELRAEVLRIAETQYGIARQKMMYLPFSGPGNERKVPTLASSVTTGWVNEGAKKGGTNPTFGLVTQTLKKLAAIIPFTEEILEDSAINLTQLVAQLFAEAVAKEEDIQFFRGTGSPWTGILNNSLVNHVDMAAGDGYSDITIAKLREMQDETPAGALNGAEYMFHRHLLSYIRNLKENGNYLYQGPREGGPATFDGYPITLVEAFPDKTTTGGGKPIAMFGNLKIAAIFGDKQQIRAKLLDQATITDGDGTTVINLAEQDMVALRLEERVGYVVAVPTAVTVLKTGSAS